jgi:hypothetical protein
MLRQKFEEMARRTQTAEAQYATKVRECWKSLLTYAEPLLMHVLES